MRFDDQGKKKAITFSYDDGITQDVQMIQLMNNIKGGDLDITALVEDGMFEKKIYYPVALYAEMLWNTDADIRELMAEVAMRGYVDFE